MELIEKLGIDWRLLIAQIVNFLILLFVLTKFAFKPLIKLLDERRATIEKSLENADRINKNLEDAARQKEELILKARHGAKDILEEAKREAIKVRDELIRETRNEVSKFLESGRSQLERDKEQMRKELRAETAELVIEATKKVLRGTVDEKVNREYVNRILKM